MLGCSKIAALMGVSLTSAIYTPRDFADFALMQNMIEKKLARILEAQTTEEIRTIGW